MRNNDLKKDRALQYIGIIYYFHARRSADGPLRWN